MPRVPWLNHQSFANVQALTAYEYHEFLERRGQFSSGNFEEHQGRDPMGARALIRRVWTIHCEARETRVF
jgi:hypothetical protein